MTGSRTPTFRSDVQSITQHTKVTMNAFLNGEKETREQFSLNFGLRKDLQLRVHFAIPSVIP